MTSAQYEAVEASAPAPASRVAIFATASMIVGVLTAVIPLINPQVFTREHDPAGFRNYMRFEMALATVVWMMTVMPAFMPLLRRLGDLLGFSAD
jgi:hypothetical protein